MPIRPRTSRCPLTETQPLRNRANPAKGFSLAEVLVSIVVLSIGLLSVAALMGQMAASTNKSRYMSAEALLASEKLEDLSRFPLADPALAAGGSLTADLTDWSGTTPIDYFDQVQISSGNGAISETMVSGKDESGNPITTTITHTPDGKVTPTPLDETALALTFKRRWVIEKDVPITGLRRITVLVTMENAPAGSATPKFQMSTVRQ